MKKTPIVVTHTDRAHVHNHIVFNSTSIDATRKFKNFWLSSFALQKKPESFDAFLQEQQLNYETKFFWDSENTMAMNTGNEFEGHMEGTELIVFVSTGRAKASFTARGSEFQISAVRRIVA